MMFDFEGVNHVFFRSSRHIQINVTKAYHGACHLHIITSNPDLITISLTSGFRSKNPPISVLEHMTLSHQIVSHLTALLN